uniref:Centrosomal protein 128 n=1 Tax=Seriola dumerili TaxID=41447 RepID=A0A3B4TUE3_SERDU
MDTTSESDSYDRTPGDRARGREAHRRPGRDRGRASGSGGDDRAVDISKKISTLANTLQDTSRNLTKVDRMLGQYREHTDDQTEAMALLRENLEESISQLQTQRLIRSNGARSASASASTLHTSDLEIHSVHQSLRDLRCDQQRLSDDLDREILRRNRYLRQGTQKSETVIILISSLIMCVRVCVRVRACVCVCVHVYVLDRSDLEKEVAELRVQLCKASVLGEVEELKRALERKEKERVQLSLQVEVWQAEKRETEALLQESTRNRDELKNRAQEAVRQWRAKCKRLQKELEETRAQTQFHTDKALQQRGIWLQQTEAAHRELTEILGRLAQREEELHRKDVELSETRQRQLSLEQEIREQETQRQAAIQARLREENQRLEERADSHARRCQRDQDTQAELQAALKQMTLVRAQLAQQLAEEESSKKELQKGTSQLQAKLTVVQEEQAALGQQLKLEREVHQKELNNMKATMEDSRIKKDREVQDTLQLCRQERDEMQAQLKEVKADAVSDKELCGVLRIKLDRMKDECDKLAAQLSTKDEAHALLHRKYHLLKQELDDKVRSGDRRHALESKLEEKVLRMETEQEAIFTSMGEELDAACRSLARNGEDKLQVFNFITLYLLYFTKLRWLCEEVRERDTREQRLRKQHQQTRDQLKALRQSRDSEQAALLQRLDQQEKLLFLISELLERSRRKEEEMRSLQVSIMSLLIHILALDHLESIPEKQCLMENFKDLEESHRQREMVEQRYTKYKEIVWNLQHQLDESKRRIQEYRDEKMDTTSRSLRLAALSSSIKGPSTYLSSSMRFDTLCEYLYTEACFSASLHC